MSPALVSTDAKNKLEDLSGAKIQPGENPYKALIEACGNDAVRSKVLYLRQMAWLGITVSPAVCASPLAVGCDYRDAHEISRVTTRHKHANICEAQAEIESLYSTHRVARNAQQKDKFLSPEFKEVLIDPFLLRLENPSMEPGFSDPRNCLVFWARPPEHVVKLAAHLQSLLKKAAPSRWTMSPHRHV